MYKSRRSFLQTTALASMGIGLQAAGMAQLTTRIKTATEGKRVGIIGADTSHTIAFARALNAANADAAYSGYKVTVVYPPGSKDIASSASRIPAYTEELKGLGIQVAGSISELLQQADVVMLETNDGRMHLEQALPVLQAGKRMFIDKPVAASMADAVAIYKAAEKYKVPIFSASSLRYIPKAQEAAQGKLGKVLGADTYSPATLEKTHPDLFWYGIHGVELLFTVMGSGCKSVSRVHMPDTDMVVGTWKDDRIGTFRGTRKGPHDYGGTVFTEKSIQPLGAYHGYAPLLVEIVRFFESGVPPVSSQDTLEIYAFMAAADESKKQHGAAVTLHSILKKHL